MNCPICNDPCPQGYQATCGNSYCQEASSCECLARSERRKARRRALLDQAARARSDRDRQVLSARRHEGG